MAEPILLRFDPAQMEEIKRDVFARMRATIAEVANSPRALRALERWLDAVEDDFIDPADWWKREG